MNKLLLLISCGVLFISIGCKNKIRGNGRIVTENRSVPAFTQVKLSSSFDVELSPGPVSVSITSDENLIKEIETEVEDGTLRIRTANDNWLRSKNPILIRVQAPRYNGIYNSGSGNINSSQLISISRELEIKNSGSGNVNLELDAPEVNASLSGSGIVSLRGQAKKVHYSLSGSGDMDAHQLLAELATGKVSGSGNMTLYGSRNVDAHVSGSGQIRYKGGGNLNSKSSGSGQIVAY